MKKQMKKRFLSKKTAILPGTLALLLAAPLGANAGSASLTVNIPGFGSHSSGSHDIATTPIIVASPVFTTIQNNTEMISQPEATAEAQPGATAAAVPPIATFGIDNYISKDVKIYNLPASWSITPDLQLKLDLPIVTAVSYTFPGGDKREKTGLGDISLSAKYRLGSEDTLESHTLITSKFASGDHKKGLGTGSYDISVTEKLIKRIADLRITLMGGINQPLNKPDFYGYKVSYGTTLSYMLGVEHKVVWPEFWLGLRTAGMHAFDGKLDGITQNNAITTLDIIPEAKYYLTKGFATVLGVSVPVLTKHGDSNKNDRDVMVNFGFFKSF